MDTIDNAMATADHAWRAYGVRRADRAALAADLRLDLESAAADGIRPTQLLGADVRGFARRLADEAAVRRVPPAYGHVLGIAFFGAALGAIVGYAYLLVYPLLVAMPDTVPVQVAIIVYYGVPAAAVIAGAVAAVRIHLHDEPVGRSTAKAMAVLLPIAAIVITPIAMASAWLTGYSTGSAALVEVALVGGAFAGAVVLARRWSLRESAVDQPVEQHAR